MRTPRTKILCTIGPASGSLDILCEMIRSGMAVARLNFSHGTYEQHKQYIQNIRKASRLTGKTVGILADLQGPKIRIGQLEEDTYRLKSSDTIVITVKDVIGNRSKVSTSYSHLVNDVKPGDKVLIDDGKLRLIVLEKRKDEIECRVLGDADLKPRKGINLPGIPLSTPSVTEKDVDDIDFAVSQDVDFIAVSFVRKPDDIIQIRSLLKGAAVKIVAKIERPEALEVIDDIVDVSDGIMVARGDLGIEIPLEQVPLEQKRIIKCAHSKNKFVITATQMLDSMIESATPTRAEVSDVANSILDGTDAIMLSGETSTGAYPSLSVDTMSRIAEATENDMLKKSKTQILGEHYKKTDLSIAHSAAIISRTLDVRHIVAFTKSGHTALLISVQKPPVGILCFTPDSKVARQASIYWGVTPMVMEDIQNISDLLSFISPALKNRGLVNNGEKVILTLGVPFGIAGTTNLIHVLNVE